MIRIPISVLAGLLPTYLVRFSVFGIPTNFFEVAVMAVFTLCMAIPAIRRHIVSSIGRIPYSAKIWICLFVLSAIISTLFSPVLLNSLGILKGWFVIPILLAVLLQAVHVQTIIRSLIVSGLVVALIGISQLNSDVSRIYSIYDVPNSLALYLAPIFLLATWVGIQKKDRLYQMAGVIMLIAIICTQSFGAVIAIIGTMLVGWLMFRLTSPSPSFVRRGMRRSLPLTKGELEGVSDGRKYAVLFFLLFLVTVSSFFFLSGRIQYLISPLIHSNANSVTVRVQLWDIGIRLIQQHPVRGIGLGQFEGAYQAELHHLLAQQASGLSSSVYRLQPEFVFRDPHNWIISFWLNAGLLGLVSFTALNIISTKKLRAISPPRMRGSHPPLAGGGGRDGEHVYNQAAALALISILIFGLFDTIYWKNDLSALWWLLIILRISR